MREPPVKVTRHNSELGSWEMASRAPHPLLAGQVLRYAGYVERTKAPLPRLEAPFGGVVVILSFDERLRLVDARGRDEMHTSFTAGLSDGPTYSEHAGAQHGLQIDLTPPAARALLGLPLRELTNRVVSLEEVLGPTARQLVERLYEQPSWHECFRLLDRELGPRLASSAQVPPSIRAAWQRLRETHGGAEIGELATRARLQPPAAERALRRGAGTLPEG